MLGTVITVTFTTVIALTGLEHLLCAGWFTYIIALILSVTLKVGNRPYFYAILQMRKLRLIEVNLIAQHH